MSAAGQTAFNTHRDEVERRMSAGETFESIETAIDSTAATDEEKAALWLLAWSEQPRRIRQRLVIDVLDHAAQRA
jgi:hypothetical protein